MKIERTRVEFVKRFVSILFLALTFATGYGQTTYTWVGPTGGSFATTTNWSPARPVAATSTDILVFNNTGAITVTGITTQTIGQLQFLGNSDVTLQAGAATQALRINGPTLNNNLVVEATAILRLGSVNTFTLQPLTTANQRWDISGKVVVNTNNTFNTSAVGTNLTTVSATGSVDNNGGTFTTTAATFVFSSGSNYNHLATTTSMPIPLATWDVTSNININSITTATALTGFTQTFGNVTFNSPSQTSALVLSSAATINGNLNITSTGSGSVVVSASVNTLNVNGDFNLSAGTFNLNSAAMLTTLNLAGNYNQTGGNLTKSGATSVAAFNFTGIGKTYTQSGGTVTNTLINYALNGTGASLTLNSGIVIPVSRSFTVTNGTLYCGTNVISGAGSFVLANSANAILGIGSPAGITANPTATGNIQTTTRTYNLAAGYMYMGGNGQVTGAGLPVTMTGSIYVNMASPSDLLTFTSTALSGNGVNVRMMVGGLANAITYTNATNSILTYEGVAAQTVTPNEFPTSTGPKTLVVNNLSGVTLGASRSVVTLNLTNGILSNGSNTLTVTGTLAASVVGGSATSYVAGALARTFTSTIAASFPIGKSSYQLLTINPTVSGNVVLTAEAFDGDAGGTGGAGVGSLNTDHYWSLAKTSTGALTSIGALSLTDAGVNASNHICYSSTQAGTYSISPSTVAGNVISPINPLPVPAGAANVNSTGYFVIGTGGTLSGTIAVGNSSSVQKLYQIANLLNTSTVTGDVIFELQADYDGTTGEIYPINFYQYTTTGGSWTATVRPAAGATGLVTSGNPGSGVAFVAYNGVDKLTFDGRPGGTGNSIEWILRNTQTAATYTPTLQFINDATYNTVQYVQIESQNALTSNGTVVIGTSTGTTGNDYNTIQYCNIRDRSDAVGYPANGIYAATVLNKENDHNVIYGNNVFNFWANGAEANGIYVGAYNTDWDIKSNSLYQTVTRTATSAGSITARNYGIRIASTAAGYNFNIDSNYIGGTAPSAVGSPWTQNTTATLVSTFTGIHVDANTGSTNNIRYNKISNIFWRCGNLASAAAPGIFSGIYVLNGGANTEFNTIGGATGTDSIIITANATTGPMSFGIAHAGSSGTATVASNIVGAITANASAVSVSHSFTGIYVGQAGSSSTRYVTDNLVGSLTTPNSIHVSNASTSTTGQSLFGISIATGANPMIVTGNTVVNLSNKYAGTVVGGQTVGMQALSGSGNFANNNVYNISSTSLSAGTGTTAGVIGIYYAPTVAGNTFANNTVYSLSNTAATAAVNVSGMVYSGPATNPSSNYVEKNLVHSLTLASSNGTATITGINHLAGYAFFRNNMVRLGITPTGTPVTNGCVIIGFNKASVTTSYIYHNSIYVGGTGVTGSAKTYAFKRTNTLFTTSTRDAIKNNILANNRSNGAGTGLHFAIGITQFTGLGIDSCNYNLLEAAGTGGNTGENNTTPLATLGTWRSSSSPSQDNASYYGSAAFIDPIGDAATVDLHINPSVPTQVEANAIPLSSVSDDYDGDTRTSPDIGADEGSFTPIDLSAPTVSYTPFANACNDVITHNVTVNISDASGVNTAAGLAPRVYYKKTSDATNTYNDNTSATTGWKYVETASTSSPFSFNIDFTLINGGITAGDAIQYFVVAQDMATPNPNNVGINSGTATFAGMPASVALASGGFPIGGTPNQFSILPCSGTVTVGTGGNYGVFTTANGIFNAINQATLSGNLTINVISDIVNLEDGAVGLNQWAESGIGGYSVTIQSSANVLRTISGSSGVNAGLFRMNGADRVTFNGGIGANKYLTFRNTAVATSASVFNFTNDATNITVNNCTIEGGAVSATGGVVVFGTSGTGSGNDNITITSCDIKDAASLPTNGIYSAGTTTAGKENSNVTISNCNIYNFFTPTAASSGILIATGNNTWSITNNRFYQTAVRTTTTASLIHSVIRVNNSNGGGFNISDNYIGGNNAAGTGTMAYASATSPQMGAIYMTVAGTPASTVSSNTIQNMSFSTISATTSNQGTFSAIYASNGTVNIQNNAIGSVSDTSSIAVLIGTNSGGIVAGVKITATGSSIVSGNTIGGLTARGTGSNNAINLYGIHFTAGTVNVNNNLVGSTTLSNSLQVYGTATTNASTIAGIFSSAGASYTPIIAGNQIRGLYNYNTGTATTASGINVSSGAAYSVNSNTIYNITSASAATGSGTSSSVSGILYSTGVTVPVSVSQNTIYNLLNTSTAATFATGIYYNGGTNNGSSVSKNNIYNLVAGAGTSTIVGMHIASASGPLTISNNMIRLGYNVSGGSITNASAIHGILKDNTGASFVYHNSIYIGGVGVASTAVNTHAYRKTATTGNDNLRNNIFVNARANATTGGKHYAYWSGIINGSISNYNLFYAPSGVLFSLNNADQTTLAGWKGLTGNPDINSAVADPNFAAPTATVADLHLASPSPAEGGGVDITTVTDDIDGDIRAANTPVDLGADATIVAQQDIYPPTISYTAIPTQATCSATITNVQVTVTDPGAGLSLTVNKPRMYIRKSSGTPTTAWGVYPSVEGVFTSGNSNVSVWDFTVDYSLLGITVVSGDQFEYYFVVQDQATIPNVGYSQQNVTTPVHSDVATQVAPPNFVFGATGVYAFSSPLFGTVTVGTGGTYTTFNGPSGLFNALNTRGISGNLTVEVISDINESGLYTILGPIQEYCGSGYTVVIQPNSTTVRTVYATTGGNPLISMAGCKRVTFQGQYNGVGQYLTFAQRQNMPTFYLNGVSSTATEFISVLNCTVEGNNTLTNSVGPGVINFAGLLGTGSAIRNILIDGNTIRNRSDLAQSQANIPANLISVGVSNGTNLPLKSAITISNNSMFNFSNSAVSISQNLSGNGIGDSIIITGNKIYEAFAVNTYQYPIWLESGNGKGHTISNNKIGGNAAPNPNISGTWTNNKFDGEVVAIYTLNGGSTPNDGILISGNIISNIALNGTDYTNFIGIRNEGGGANISNNIIGSATVANSIVNYGSGNVSDLTANSATIGIWNQALEDVVISNNTVANMRAYYSAGVLPYQYVQGIAHGSNQYHNNVDYTNSPGGKVSITGNSVFNLSSGSILASLNISPDALIGIFSFSENGSTGNEISGNTVYGLRVTEGWLNTSNNTRLYGIGIGLGQYGSTQTGSLYNNVVYDLNNNSRANVPEINGVLIGGGNWTVYNNMVTITNSAYTAAAPMILGIGDWMTSGRTGAYYHNSVYVGGTLTNGVNSSYAFCRVPDGLGNVYGSNVNIRNNIFFNDRTGGSTNNVAIGNLTQGNSADAAVGWNSNNNFIVTRNANQVGRWVGTAAGDRSFTNWQTTSGGDANSVTATITTGNSNATQVNPMELFVSLASGNLRINTSPPNSPHPYSFVRNNGSFSIVTTDIDSDPRDISTPDLGCDEFTDCSTPIIALTANGTSGVSTVCSGSTVILNVTNAGSGTNCAGFYEYAIASGGMYWDGVAFASATPLYSSTYSNISFIPGSSASYTGIIACNTDQTCKSSSNNVTINILDSVASINATIGTPANGVNHYMSITWSAVIGATGYDVDYSNNGSAWSNVASNVPITSFSHNTGDNPNVPTYYRVRPRNTSVVCNYTTMAIPVYTACDAPELPLVNGVTSNTVNVTLQAEAPVVNPAYTTYSIFCTTTNQYLQIDGTLGSTEIFQTSSQWGTITVTGLLLNTSYCFYAKAKNMDGDIRAGANSLIPVEQFNSDVITQNGNLYNMWFAPDSYAPISYASSGGCIGGMAGYSGSFNNFWGNFIRTPEQNCNGMTSIVVSFDLSNSYFSTQTDDHIRFYMWDNYYSFGNHYYEASSVKISGIEVSYTDINGIKLLFNQARTCMHVEVTFDFNAVGYPLNHRDKTLFYLEANCNYNNSNVFGVSFDNISIASVPPASCASTISCIAPAIVTQPTIPATLCTSSGVATISVDATGTGLTYQWRKNGSNITTGGIYTVNSTSNGSVLTITNPAANDAGNYDVVISGLCSPPVTSNTVALTVNAPISGLVANANNPVCEGFDLNLSGIVNTGTGISWAWSGPGFSANTQSPTLIETVETVNEGVYTVTASNACNTAVANITVNVHRNPIGLVVNVSSTQICLTDTLELFATYLGQPIPDTDVQWSWTGPNGFIANTQNAFRTPLNSNDDGIYDVFATNACGVQSAGSANINVDEFIEADAGPDDITNVCGVLTAQLQGNSYGTGTGSWSEISSGVTLYSPANTDSDAVVTADGFGLRQYRWTITNGACVSEDDVRYFFDPPIIATVDLAGCNFTNADSVFINVTASGGSSILSVNAPLGNELKLDVDGNKIYTSPMDGIQRIYTISDGICNVNANVTSPTGHPTDIPYVSANGTVTADCYDNSFTKWLTFRDVNNDAILSVNDNGQNLGKVSASVYRDTTEPVISQVSAGVCQGVEQLAMKRHFVLTSTAPQPFAGDISVRLYFSEAELNDLVAATQANDIAGDECTQYDNLTGLSELYVTKYTGADEDGDYMNNSASGIYRVYASGDGTLQPSANGFPTIFTNGQNHHYVELNVREFSELWLHGSSTGGALPVEMIYLNAEGINNEYIKLTWATALEINNNGFVIERSTDAEHWESIGWADGHNNATMQNDYYYDDHAVSHNVRYYYRLKQVDNDGAYEYTGLVSAIISAVESVFTIKDFIPNPALNSTTLVVVSPTVQNIQLNIYNTIGQEVYSNTLGLAKGANNSILNVSDWAAGTYTAILQFNNEVYSKKLVIAK